jgi:HPt (histidine-containing phosphotransfer) domain-containing protein
MSEPILLNLDFVKTEFGDDPETITEILLVFKEVLEGYEQQMTLALAEKDSDLIYFECHKIKPSLKMFGLLETVAILEKVEFMSKSQRPVDEMEMTYARIKEQFPRIHVSIDAILVENQ